MVNAIKEQQQQIETLQQKNANQEAINQSLQKQIDELKTLLRNNKAIE